MSTTTVLSSESIFEIVLFATLVLLAFLMLCSTIVWCLIRKAPYYGPSNSTPRSSVSRVPVPERVPRTAEEVLAEIEVVVSTATAWTRLDSEILRIINEYKESVK